MNAALTFAIRLNRLPKIENAPGLILLTVGDFNGSEPPTRVGVLTDAALRSRLAHLDTHSANEIAAIRHALAIDKGQTTIYESWPGVEGCLRFWCGFVGSRVRRLHWSCDGCGEATQENIGGSAGESFPRLCRCGRINQITVPKFEPSAESVPAGARREP